MNVHSLPGHAGNIRDELLVSVDRCLPALRERATADDRAPAFPEEAFHLLRGAGLVGGVLPVDDGGAGLGTERDAVPLLLQVLTRLGGAHLSVARLFEGHVNAFALLWHYGTPAQRVRLSRYVREGRLLGVWNAPAPEGPLRLQGDGAGFSLRGRKIYASGAGTITRPLLTATDDAGRLLMLWCDVTKARVDLSGWQVQGMRSTATGTLDCDGVDVAKDDIFGSDDDYHRQPAFSAGAWRFVAAQLGAAGAMVELMKKSLLDAGRADDPHQRARLADAAMALESGRLWTESAARIAEDPSADPGEAVSYVGMARLVVERACMDIIALAQRSVGLRALHETHSLERISRDLATYLRQPVPDAIRDAAAGSALACRRPLLERWSP